MEASDQSKTLFRVLIALCVAAAIAVIVAVILAFTTCSSPQEEVAEIETATPSESKKASALPNTLLVEPPTGAPALEISYPDGWEPFFQVNPSDITGLTSGSVSAGVNDGSAYVELLYMPFDGDPYGIAFDLTATIVKVADANFVSADGSALGNTDAGPFMVAEVEYANIDDSPGKTSKMLALLPASFAGKHPISVIQATTMMPFMYAGQAVYFYCRRSDELTADQRQTVIEILANLQVAQ